MNTSVVHQFELIEHHHLIRRINFSQELGNFYLAHIDTSSMECLRKRYRDILCHGYKIQLEYQILTGIRKRELQMKLISKDSRNLKLAVLAHGNLSTLVNLDVFTDLDDNYPDFSSNLGFLNKNHKRTLGYEMEDNGCIHSER